MSTILNPELTELPIERLRLRRSAKWARYPADVLPAWVAEMDFPLAEPVRVALAAAVELDDCGYAWPQGIGLAEAFAGFAASRMGWSVDPAAVSPSPDVVGAVTAVLRAVAEPGRRVIVNTPVYHPFFAVIEELGCELAEAPLDNGELEVEAIELESRRWLDAVERRPGRSRSSTPTPTSAATTSTATGRSRRSCC
jgi:cystathionine beta-lyase